MNSYYVLHFLSVVHIVSVMHFALFSSISYLVLHACFFSVAFISSVCFLPALAK